MVQVDWNVVSIVAAREPVIEINVENLPPYQDENKKTNLTIKTVGTAGTTSDL